MSSPDIPSSVRASAPGGIGNIGPGLDILGCAVAGVVDTVRVRRIPEPIIRVDDPGHPDLTRDPERHASAIAAAAVRRMAGADDVGIALSLEKNLPLAGGQGGSAASAVAGAVATNALLGNPLTRAELLRAALESEERLSGRHIDNLAPELFGGILLIRSIEPLEYIRLPVPDALRIVLVQPRMQVRTADSRAVLPAHVDRATALAQASAVSAMVAAFCTGDLSLLRGAIDDRIAEPARAPMLPGFVSAKRAASEAGALGCSISGGGPSAFALADSDHTAARVQDAMLAAYAADGVQATGRVTRVDERGARVDDCDPPLHP
ncbi:MAG TPA: homoserine kinase [Gemmatimonadaceae bacterium]|nr:homoserine kinase [Gemmatimonadaceae bacterium]